MKISIHTILFLILSILSLHIQAPPAKVDSTLLLKNLPVTIPDYYKIKDTIQKQDINLILVQHPLQAYDLTSMEDRARFTQNSEQVIATVNIFRYTTFLFQTLQTPIQAGPRTERFPHSDTDVE